MAIELCNVPNLVAMNDVDVDPLPEPEPEPEPAVEIPGPRVTELDEGIGRISPGITICAEAVVIIGYVDVMIWYVLVYIEVETWWTNLTFL